MREKFVYKTKQKLGEAAAAVAAEEIAQAIESKGQANIILATGASQFEALGNLVVGIDDGAEFAFPGYYVNGLLGHDASSV